MAWSTARRLHSLWDDGGSRAPARASSSRQWRSFSGRRRSLNFTCRGKIGLQRLPHLPVAPKLHHDADCFSSCRSARASSNQDSQRNSAGYPFTAHRTHGGTRSSFHLLTTVARESFPTGAVCKRLHHVHVIAMDHAWHF